MKKLFMVLLMSLSSIMIFSQSMTIGFDIENFKILGTHIKVQEDIGVNPKTKKTNYKTIVDETRETSIDCFNMGDLSSVPYFDFNISGYVTGKYKTRRYFSYSEGYYSHSVYFSFFDDSE
mgnify:CR=1 FL=1